MLTWSLSSWRAWIEMSSAYYPIFDENCRSPHGERGLKFRRGFLALPRLRSLSSWRAWIEMYYVASGVAYDVASLSSWRAWIEMCLTVTMPALFGRSPHGERGLKCG